MLERSKQKKLTAATSILAATLPLHMTLRSYDSLMRSCTKAHSAGVRLATLPFP